MSPNELFPTGQKVSTSIDLSRRDTEFVISEIMHAAGTMQKRHVPDVYKSLYQSIDLLPYDRIGLPDEIGQGHTKATIQLLFNRSRLATEALLRTFASPSEPPVLYRQYYLNFDTESKSGYRTSLYRPFESMFFAANSEPSSAEPTIYKASTVFDMLAKRLHQSEPLTQTLSKPHHLAYHTYSALEHVLQSRMNNRSTEKVLKRKTYIHHSTGFAASDAEIGLHQFEMAGSDLSDRELMKIPFPYLSGPGTSLNIQTTSDRLQSEYIQFDRLVPLALDEARILGVIKCVIPNSGLYETGGTLSVELLSRDISAIALKKYKEDFANSVSASHFETWVHELISGRSSN